MKSNLCAEYYPWKRGGKTPRLRKLLHLFSCHLKTKAEPTSDTYFLNTETLDKVQKKIHNENTDIQ